MKVGLILPYRLTTLESKEEAWAQSYLAWLKVLFLIRVVVFTNVIKAALGDKAGVLWGRY